MAEKPTYEKLEQRIKELEEETVKLRRTEEKLRESEKRETSACGKYGT